MKSANIPHLYIRNGFFYYRHNAIWKSLRTQSKQEAIIRLGKVMSGDTCAFTSEQSKAPRGSTVA